MGTIRVEAVPVQSYFLGLFGFDHLQLVYQDETDIIDRQDFWFVIEGVQDGPLTGATLGAMGENGTTSLAVANGASSDALVDTIGTPEQRGSRIVYSGPDAAIRWNQLASFAGEIEAQQYPYIAATWPFSATPTINSTSLIASLLWSIELDLSLVMPFGVRLSPGGDTLLGTSANDILTLQGSFTTLATGAGDDTLTGSTNTFFLDKLYGGSGDDTFEWTYGNDIYHGGQPRLAYELDGTDTVNLAGAGPVNIVASKYAIDHKIADYYVSYQGGTNQWFSIEEVTWNNASDVLSTGANIELIKKPLQLRLEGNGGGKGDELSFADTVAPLLINDASGGLTSVQTLANAGLDAGYWVQSAEWIAGSQGGDRIYSGPSILGVEGGGGDDIIDTRLASEFSGLSPLGYDIDVDGGAGDDVIVAGAGRTYAVGGDGSDTFVLSATSGGSGTVEFVIADADSSDRFYIPYDLFTVNRGTYEGSDLFQLTGGVFKITDIDPVSLFHWGPFDDDEVQGNIEFSGQIEYAMDGADLVISITQGTPATENFGTDEFPIVYTYVDADPATLTQVRVIDWTDGDLGITFPLTFDVAVLGQAGSLNDYPGLMDIIDAATAPDKFIAPLEERPAPYVPLEIASNTSSIATTATFSLLAAPALTADPTDANTISGTDGDDTLVAGPGGPYTFDGGDGNDNITGSDGGDVLVGGSGSDVMAGGRGNDAYSVDDPGDAIVEAADGGFDKVYASIDYTLPEFVEFAVLEEGATSITGNGLDNRLLGNAGNNIISGGDGEDTLAGDRGNDTLIGGEGGDGYVYELGDGADTIIETGLAGDDVIVLAGGLSFDDVTFVRDPAQADDLKLAFNDGGSLTIAGYFAGPTRNIEGLALANGTALAATEFSARADAAVSSFNLAPVANPDVYVYQGGDTLLLPLEALTRNDSDGDGEALTVLEIRDIAGGSAVLDGNGHVVVSRTGTASTVSFEYTVSDGAGGLASASVEITMRQNLAPVVTSTTIGPAAENEPASGQILASDPEDDTLIFRVKDGAGPSKGSVTFEDDGQFIYTPDSNTNGSESFTVSVTDGFHDPSEVVISFDIAAANHAPVANDDSGFSVEAGATLAIGSATLLANDTDDDNDTLIITDVASVSGGTAAVDTNGDVTFIATSDYEGPASFSYTISDRRGGSDTATVMLDVTALPPPPEDNVIIGTPYRDVLYSTPADDTFYGKGGRDTFVFRPDVGNDVIKDFESGWWFWSRGDVLDLRGNGFTSYWDFLSHIHWDWHDTVIDLPSGGSVTLEGVSPFQLNFDNLQIF